ncbi:MAG: hypothetical protein C0483_07835 [Pirellula sp.]|nr:hypothetical protein [Pirellula sp.]
MPFRFALAALLLACGLSAAPQYAAAAELQLLFEEGFENGADHWKPTDAAAWKIIDSGKSGKAYSLFQQSKYKPPHRSPFNIALLDDVEVTEFRIEADVLSTAREYGHRSMVMVFGYQDPAHFYYVHFGKQMDDHANQIFIVNDAPRIKISKTTTEGTPWNDEWHHVKIERNPGTGDIKIFFDDMEKPTMTAVDKTFTWGKVGLGSFDDVGNWDNVKLWGAKK